MRCQAGHVQRRVGVVLADQAEDPSAYVLVVRNVDRLDHRGDHVDRVVLEGDDALRAGAHADAAAAAAGGVGLRRALLVLVERAEGALLGAALALGAAVQEELREASRRRTRGCTALP